MMKNSKEPSINPEHYLDEATDKVAFTSNYFDDYNSLIWLDLDLVNAHGFIDKFYLNKSEIGELNKIISDCKLPYHVYVDILVCYVSIKYFLFYEPNTEERYRGLKAKYLALEKWNKAVLQLEAGQIQTLEPKVNFVPKTGAKVDEIPKPLVMHDFLFPDFQKYLSDSIGAAKKNVVKPELKKLRNKKSQSKNTRKHRADEYIIGMLEYLNYKLDNPISSVWVDQDLSQNDKLYFISTFFEYAGLIETQSLTRDDYIDFAKKRVDYITGKR